MPAAVCATCHRPLPREAADAPAEGRKYDRMTVMSPPGEGEALKSKMTLVTERYAQAAGVAPSRHVMLDWVLQEILDRGIVPAEEGE